jgi:hypothetical protein
MRAAKRRRELGAGSQGASSNDDDDDDSNGAPAFERLIKSVGAPNADEPVCEALWWEQSVMCERDLHPWWRH